MNTVRDLLASRALGVSPRSVALARTEELSAAFADEGHVVVEDLLGDEAARATAEAMSRLSLSCEAPPPCVLGDHDAGFMFYERDLKRLLPVGAARVRLRAFASSLGRTNLLALARRLTSCPALRVCEISVRAYAKGSHLSTPLRPNAIEAVWYGTPDWNASEGGLVHLATGAVWTPRFDALHVTSGGYAVALVTTHRPLYVVRAAFEAR